MRNSKEFKMLYNPEITFVKRLYSSYHVDIKRIKLRETLHKVSSFAQSPALAWLGYADVQESNKVQHTACQNEAERNIAQDRIFVLILMHLSQVFAVCIFNASRSSSLLVPESKMARDIYVRTKLRETLCCLVFCFMSKHRFYVRKQHDGLLHE